MLEPPYFARSYLDRAFLLVGNMENEFNLFFQLTKVDEARREVYGLATAESPDRVREIMDYASSKPNFEQWSAETERRSGGKSKGNMREMHQPIAAGKVISIDYDDISKAINIGTYVSDDNTWRKILDGTLTGFSIGGTAKRFPDRDNPTLTRFTAYPQEISFVDSPALPMATFKLIKMDGSIVDQNFVPAKSPTVPTLDCETTPTPGQLAVQGNIPAEKPITMVADHFAAPASLVDELDQPLPSTSLPPLDVAKFDLHPEVLDVLKSFNEAVNTLVGLRKADADEKTTQEAKLKQVGSRVGIARKDGEPLTPPKGYPTSFDDYGDPANYSWPYDTKERCQSAIAYFNGSKGKNKYSEREWNTLGRRIASRAGTLFSVKYQYNPQKKEVSRTEDAKMQMTKGDFMSLVGQLRAGIDAAVNELGNNPDAAKDMLISLIGGQMTDDTSSISSSGDSSPTPPTQPQQSEQFKGAGTAPAQTEAAKPGTATTTTGTTGTMTSGTSLDRPTATGTMTSTTTPEMTKMDAVIAQMAELTKAIAGLVQANTTAPVVKSVTVAPAPAQNLPVGDLAALRPAPAPEKAPEIHPALKKMQEGGDASLQKAAQMLGTEEDPDYAGLRRLALEQARREGQAAMNAITAAHLNLRGPAITMPTPPQR